MTDAQIDDTLAGYEPAVREFMQTHNLTAEDLKAHSERQELPEYKESNSRDLGDDEEQWLLVLVSQSDVSADKKVHLMEYLGYLIAMKNKHNNMVPELIDFEEAMNDLDQHQNFPRTIRNEFSYFKEIMRRWK